MKRLTMIGAMTASALVGLGGVGTVGFRPASANQTLKIITWVNPPAVTVLKKINSEFHKKYPNINVVFQTAADRSGPYATLESTSIRGNTVDIMGTGPIQPLPPHPNVNNLTNEQLWGTHGLYIPLNNQPWVNQFLPNINKTETYHGKLVGMVTGTYTQGVYYNKAIFAKYHLAVPHTYNAFIALCKTLKSHGVTPLFDGLQNVGPGYLGFIYETLMAEVWRPHVAGGNLNHALSTGTVKWTAPDFIKVMQREKTIMHYLEPNFQGVPWQSMPGDFAAGKAAMLLDGSWDLAAVHTANPKMQVGFFPMPGSNHAQYNVPFVAGDLTWVVLKSGPDHSAALKWLNFFSSPKIYQQYVDYVGITPSEKGGTYQSFAQTVLGKWFGKGVNAAQVFPDLPASGPYWDQSSNWPKLQLDMYLGKYTPKQVASMYEQGWSQVIR